MELAFINLDLEERMLSGRSKKSVSGTGYIRHTGSQNTVRNPIDIMLEQTDVDPTSPELQELFAEIDKL